ncbi:unnamed protein product [Rotaria sordida]|uniref:Reverse transcriptase domain-containing protein n=2 Tax=Rotaria sordida TaxID=392033 RepID=A0A816AJB5_9BILA|nr:unnamed protein product [Rotaria sordida]CAF1598888.1 unnamed protein product [Rotaria sordida]
MSSITYSNPTNPIPVQQQPIASPPQGYIMSQRRRRGGVLGANLLNYGPNPLNYGGNPLNSNYGGNHFNNFNYRGNRRFSRNYPNTPYPNTNVGFYPPRNYRRNIFYNRNYRPQPYYTGYGIVNQPIQPMAQQERRFIRRTSARRISQNRRSGSRSNQRRSRSRQQRRRVPRQIRLNDFMPQELREPSPNLPNDFNLATTNAAITTASNLNNVPVDALPQRTIFASNVTQPFVVNNTNVNGQRQQQGYGSNQQRQQTTTTTSSFRRRNRRIRQQQYRQNQNIIENNRFAVLAENNLDKDDNVDLVSDVDENEPVLATNISKKNQKKKKNRSYLIYDRILTWIENNTSTATNNIIGKSGNHAYLMASIPIYDEWIRTNYDIQVWENYLKMGTENKHWAKEIIQRTKKRDDVVNTQFVKKKINQLSATVAQANATITDLKIQLHTYWSQIPVYKKGKEKEKEKEKGRATTDDATQTDSNIEVNASTSVTPKSPAVQLSIDTIHNKVDELEKLIFQYLKHCTQHVKKMHETRIQVAKIQMDEFKALEDFEQIATPSQWNIHLILKPKMKLWSTKNKNYLAATKRVEYDMPPRFIEKVDLSFKIDESIISQDEAQATYNQMKQITKDFRIEAMTLYVQSLARENELLTDEIKRIITGFPQDNDEGFDAEPGYAAFKHYHDLREKRLKLEAEQSIHFLVQERVEGETNEVITPTLDEYELLKLGPRFIYNSPKTASRRRTTELATLKRKIEARFFDKKVSPGRPVEQFIAELDLVLQKLHNESTINQQYTRKDLINTSIQNSLNLIQLSQRQSGSSRLNTIKKKKNCGRLVKRLKHKLKLTNIIIRKSDKSKVFHLGKLEDYRKKSEEYMEKTEAYKCLGTIDPLPDLIQRTNNYLLNLRLAKWITQKQYEMLCINSNEVELAHLYYLPKAHKPGTPLRPIISGLKHPTIKISKFLDELLRPLFDKMALKTTVTSGFELLKKVQKWCEDNLCQETIFCTIDVADLYTMVPQTEGVLSLKKMLDHLKLKQINGLKIETIIRLSRFVMKNNYFSYNGQYYHQIRGGAMGSPLTLTVANCYMFFYEQQIIKQINNSGGLYFRYIDDIFLVINWPARHLFKQIDRWNHFDENIKLSENIGPTADFLDLHMENQDGQLFTTIFQKPSYEPYYLPFNSIHPLHMKKNIIFTMLLRALRYCSTFQEYLNEREKLRMALLLNKYPNKFIDEQFNNVLQKLNIQALTCFNYVNYRQEVIDSPIKEVVPVDYGKTIFIHFTYCSSMKTFPRKFHTLWNKYFGESPINDVLPILGTRNVKNLQRQLTYTK